MIDFNYTAPELLPFRIQEVLDAPNEPHRIGGVVYVPEGGGECEVESKIFIEGEYVPCPYYEYEMECGGQFRWDDAEPPNHCPNCGANVKAVDE